MKRFLRLFPMLLLCVCALTACGSDDNDDNDNITEGKNGEYVINGHKFVDLGLPSGLLWAECNVGASTPEDAGFYYAWGEMEPKDNYIYKNYKFYGGTKYNTSDAKVTLEATDDVATMKWGKRCHIPTVTEMKELYSNCVCTWTDSNGSGYIVTGPNGRSIFLPAAGHNISSTSNAVSSEFKYKGSLGAYWSSSTLDESSAQILLFASGIPGISIGSSYNKWWGISIRPVARK